MQLTATESLAVDYANAQFLATASLLAYTPADEDLKTEFADTLGLTAEPHGSDHLRGVAAYNETNVVVAFRGTQSPLHVDGLKDWLLTNAKTKLVIPGGQIGTDFLAAGVDARFHQGFIEGLDAVWEAIFPTIEAETNRQDRPVWVTGHSLGGALATLAAWRLKRKGIKIHQAYTFGAPMFCNIGAVEVYNLRLAGRIHRFVNEHDVVPLLPVTGIPNPYRHVGVEEVLASTEANGGTAAEVGNRIMGLIGTLAGGNPLTALRTILWQEVLARAEAHSLSNGYLVPIARRLKQEATANAAAVVAEVVSANVTPGPT